MVALLERSMRGLNEFENAVLEKLLAGDHPVLVALRAQAETGRVVIREYTGAGFFCTFETSPNAPALNQPSFHCGDVEARIDGLTHGAGFIVFVRDGRLNMLEGFSYDEPWPEVVGNFELRYRSEPRRLALGDKSP